MQRHTTAISQTNTHPPPRLPCQPHRLYCVFFLLESNSLLFNVNAMLATPEMRSSQYSSKWCGFLSRCPGPSVPACRFLPVCLFLSLLAFRFIFCFPSLFILFSCCFNLFFLFPSFLGVTEPRLSELSVCYRTVHLLIAMADCTN